MGISGNVSVNLLAVILFLLPGLAGVKLGLERADRADWLNRTDTTVLSFFVSIISMIFLYIGQSALQNQFVTTQGLKSSLDSIPEAIGYYTLLVIVAVILGILIGEIEFGEDIPHLPSLDDRWITYFKYVKEETDGDAPFVRVGIETGDEIRGDVVDYGEAVNNRDVILKNPTYVRYSEVGEEVENYRWTGRVYIHDQSITHVEFDDLDSADEVESNIPAEEDETSKEESNIEKLEELSESADVEFDEE